MKPGTRIALTLCVFVACCSVPAVAVENNWPQFRGTASRGVSSNEGLPAKWSATENVAWKTDLPGRGWSSPIVWGDRVFVTSVINSGTSEEPKKGLYFGGDRPDLPGSVHQWVVFCLDLMSGEVLWQRQVHEGKPQTAIHLKSSYASETPTTDGERVYAYFGNVGVFCFDFEGELLWEKRLEPHKTRNGWGTASSPVLHDNRLYLVNDNDEDSFLLALDSETGDEVWRTARAEKSNWATPFIWKNAHRVEIVTPGTGQVRSYSLSGELLWHFKGMSSITIAMPFDHNGLLYVSSGYVGDRKSRPIYAIKPGAEGDITLAEDEVSNDSIAWCQKMAGPYNPSTLIYEDRLYVLYDFGFIACFNPASGEPVFEKQRIPQGRAFTTSPWGYGGMVFCLNEDGVTYVMNSADELEILHRNTLAEDDMAMSTPAIAGDRLLIRTSARVYCIRNGVGVSSASN
ncbi:MAG: PQQ-binding-like beta-propeller repeat protein [Fuerstiella sp.]|nr:PQQ-binding-like beta-propeller repeat protein [Fuerstiella sp.]MCP4505000.1 PQQ-binding-like beta-propeller repeat protein [Fuerstiella sp.]